MTFIVDPRHPDYAVESDVRAEVARTQDVCQSCRQCLDRCASFTSLFDLLDRFDEPDAGLLTPAQQDQILGECFHCGACTPGCPHTPELESPGVDVPALATRVAVMRRRNGHLQGADRRAARTFGRIDRLARRARRWSGLSSWLTGAPAGSRRRRWLAALTGVSASRPLGTFASTRLSTQFGDRPRIENARRSVRLYPTCLIEHQEQRVAADVVRVLERHQISCQLSEAGCCGAPLLHAGDLRRFAARARRNVRTLVDEVRDGTDLIIAEPGCATMFRDHYPLHVGGPLHDDAALVARRTVDISEFLVDAHRAGEISVDSAVVHPLPAVAYHAANPAGRGAGGELLAVLGARVRSLTTPFASDGLWSRRSGHDEVAVRSSERLHAEIGDTDEVLTLDGAVARVEVAAVVDRPVTHPIELVARSYGIEPSSDE